MGPRYELSVLRDILKYSEDPDKLFLEGAGFSNLSIQESVYKLVKTATLWFLHVLCKS